MAIGIYNIFKAEVMKKRIDLLNDTIKVALMSPAHTFDPSTDANTSWGDVSANEVSGTGYTAGGEALQSKLIGVDNNGGKGVFLAADVVWNYASFITRYAVIYDDSTNPKYLIACVDFNENKQSSSGDFTIQWDSSGILSIG